jgi:hypothetical protein
LGKEGFWKGVLTCLGLQVQQVIAKMSSGLCIVADISIAVEPEHFWTGNLGQFSYGV